MRRNRRWRKGRRCYQALYWGADGLYTLTGGGVGGLEGPQCGHRGTPHLAAVGLDWGTIACDTYAEYASAFDGLIDRVQAIEEALYRYDDAADTNTYTVLKLLCIYPTADLYKVEVKTGEGWQGPQPIINDGVYPQDVEWVEYTTGAEAVVVDGLPRLAPWALAPWA